jgi:hypothetical protein
LEYNDPVAFRFAYETGFRSRWDKGETTDLIVVLRTSSNDESDIPFDLLQAGRKVSFRLTDIFQNLSYPVLKTVDIYYYDKIYEAHNNYVSRRLSENETKDFILSHVYETAPHLIKQPSDLLRVLFDIHDRNSHIPPLILQRLLEILQQNKLFSMWPLDKLFNNRSFFLLFIHERWRIYIKGLEEKQTGIIREPANQYNLQCQGPLDLPFDHQDIKGRLSALFIERKLQPVEAHIDLDHNSNWVTIGILQDKNRIISISIETIVATLNSIIKKSDISAREWDRASYLFAALKKEIIENRGLVDELLYKKFENLQILVDNRFSQWLSEKYSTLHNLPTNPPVMVHHIPRYLQYFRESDNNKRIALVVLDGLSILQWLVIKEVLLKADTGIQFEENASYAWIPTITPVSRQSIFSGKMPMFFPDTISRTDAEEKSWKTFWIDRNLSQNSICYIKGMSENELDEVLESIGNSEIKVTGIVIDTVDRIMHGMQLGESGMLNQVRQWTENGLLLSLFTRMRDLGYQVFITSDHGNVEAKGIGIPKEGSLADTKGQRVRIFSNSELRMKVHEEFKETQLWEPIGLPQSFLPLLANERNAFANDGDVLIAHGGASIEEVMVPFVRIDWSLNASRQ